ncbi:MAG: elongation factor Ts [Epsilonproteobacteria bacterium]|nr:elongation factor Ts [Campylobacterota bacterium]
MSKITMDLVKELREKTQVGMMDCKKALTEADGDLEKAIELLRKKGAAVAAKRSENTADNGRVEGYVADDFTSGSLVHVTCETDFSANTTDMQNFGQAIAQHINEKNPADVEALNKQPMFNNEAMTVQDQLNELCAKICENIQVGSFVRYQVEGNGVVNNYIHAGSTVGALVELATDKPVGEHAQTVAQAAKDICMQIAVTKPMCITPDQLDSSVVEKERDIAREQLKASGKPDNILEKIIDGKLKKFYQDVCLLHQAFIKDDKKSIEEYLKEIGRTTGLNISIKRFVRFGVGR